MLVHRELGFGLEEIAAILDDPRTSIGTHLGRQHDLLTERVARLTKMLQAIERVLQGGTMSASRSPEDQVELFGAVFFPEGLGEQWGNTAQYPESARRMSGCTKEDWRQILDEEADLNRRFAEQTHQSRTPDDPAVTALAEEHRQALYRWFFDCSLDTQRALGQLYVEDERFGATYKVVAEGLARDVCAAITANAQGPRAPAPSEAPGERAT